MKKSTKKSILIGAAAALAASLVPYECKVEENGDFSFTSLLLGVYRRRRADGEKSAVTVTVANAPCFTAEAKARRDAALRHSIEAAAEREMFADEDDPAEGTAPAGKTPPSSADSPASACCTAPRSWVADWYRWAGSMRRQQSITPARGPFQRRSSGSLPQSSQLASAPKA